MHAPASRRLREILKTDSTDVTARWGLGLVAEQQGNPDESIAILEPISANSLNRKASLGLLDRALSFRPDLVCLTETFVTIGVPSETSYAETVPGPTPRRVR